MRILEINKFYYHKRGADKHFLDVIELLQKKGHEVAVFAMHNKNNPETHWKKYFLSEVGYAGGYSVWKKIKGFLRIYSFEAHRKINKLLDDFHPDVVHVHNIYHQLDPTILFEIKKRGIPIVMTVHDFKLINPNHSLYLNGAPYDRCKNGRFYQCFLDKCVKNSYFMSFLAMLEAYWHKILGTYAKNVDLYVAPSHFVKKTLIEWGIPVKKITVIPHFIVGEHNATSLPNTEVNEKYALYAGSVSREKGVDSLIDIFQNISGMKLYLAGSVEDDFTIPQSENIKQLGFLAQADLQKYIAGASAIVSGSRLPETFGLVALEAIAEGKPFVGFNVGAFPEIIQNGKNGFLVSDKSEFQEKINMIIDGKINFDSKLIKTEAMNRFNAQNYEKALLTVMQTMMVDKKAEIC